MNTTIAALDFGTSKIVTLVAENNGTHRCDIVGTGVAGYDGYLSDGWNNPGELDDKIIAAIAEAEKQCRRKIHDINVGVPAAFTKVFPVLAKVDLKGQDPRVTSEDVRRVFAEAEKSLGNVMGVVVHTSPAWFAVDKGKKTLAPVDLKGHELEAYISYVVADKFFVDEVTNRLTRLGFTVKGIYSVAAGETMLFLPEEDRDHTALLIDVGYLSTDVMAAEGDAMTFLNTIDVGGGHITADLAMGLNLSMHDAEECIKRRYTFGIDAPDETYVVPGEQGKGNRTITRQEVTEIVTPRVDEIAEGIKKAIEDSGINLGDWSKIYITGSGLGRNQGGKDVLAARLGRPVRDVPKRTNNFNDSSYSSVLGLIELIINTIETNNQKKSGGVMAAVGGFFRELFGG